MQLITGLRVKPRRVAMATAILLTVVVVTVWLKPGSGVMASEETTPATQQGSTETTDTTDTTATTETTVPPAEPSATCAVSGAELIDGLFVGTQLDLRTAPDGNGAKVCFSLDHGSRHFGASVAISNATPDVRSDNDWRACSLPEVNAQAVVWEKGEIGPTEVPFRLDVIKFQVDGEVWVCAMFNHMVGKRLIFTATPATETHLELDNGNNV